MRISWKHSLTRYDILIIVIFGNLDNKYYFLSLSLFLSRTIFSFSHSLFVNKSQIAIPPYWLEWNDPNRWFDSVQRFIIDRIDLIDVKKVDIRFVWMWIDIFSFFFVWKKIENTCDACFHDNHRIFYVNRKLKIEG